ncbi:MAG: GNAT family N-acetyltransferase [Azospirillaceae bacterium]
MSPRDQGAPAALAIRDYRPTDLEALLDLVRALQAFEGTIFDRMKPPEAIGAWYVEHLERNCRECDGYILVAEQGGALVGYAVILTRVSAVDEIDEVDYDYAHVMDLLVAAPCRGKGIGRALLAVCEERARAAGARWLRIASLARNETAIATYRRAGFEPLFVRLEKPLDHA